MAQLRGERQRKGRKGRRGRAPLLVETGRRLALDSNFIAPADDAEEAILSLREKKQSEWEKERVSETVAQ